MVERQKPEVNRTATPVRVLLSYACLIAVLLACLSQARAPYQTTPGLPVAPSPTFVGTLRGIDAKGFSIENSDSNVLTFRSDRKTKYFRGSKPVAWLNLKVGESVSVEGRKGPDGFLEASVVRVDWEDQSGGQKKN